MTELGPGTLFDGRFRVDGVLGAGGFGTVYAATDLSDGGEVALKLIKPDRDGGYERQTTARVQRESAILAELANPHIVRLLDAGMSGDGTLFLVFERVRGRDLSDLLQEHERLPPQVAVHIVVQLLSALEEAHARGLLHRDIKPQNVRVFANGSDPYSVKLLDFGLARSTDTGAPSLTKTGEIIGTPRYMSPEQITAGTLTPRSDLYAVGVVLLELIVGSSALHGTGWMDQIDRLRNGHVLAIPDAAKLDPALLRVVHQLTAREPQDRLPSARAAIRALQRQPDEVRTTTKPTPKSKAGVAVLLIMVAVIGVAVIVAALGDRRDGVEAPVVGVTSNPLAKEVPATVEHRFIPPDVPDDAASPVDASDATLPFFSDASFGYARAVSGCGQPAPFLGTGGVEHLRTRSGRRSLAYIPDTYNPDRPYPLILLLHPAGRQAPDFLRITGFAELAEREKFIVFAPIDEVISPWDHAWDLKRAKRAIWTAYEKLCIDRERIYVVGQAAGGRVAEWLACSDFIAGGVAVSFREYEDEVLCDTARRARFMTMSPTTSKHIPVEGGRGCAGNRRKVSIAEMENRWRKRNGCRGRARTTFEYKGSVCRTWDCDEPYVSCVIAGGHTWPGSPQRPQNMLNGCDGEPPDFPHAEHIWAFLSSGGQ